MRALLLLSLLPVLADALTLQWDNDPNWPVGTTIEACVNADCISGITGNQRAFDASPGAVIDAMARAVAPDGRMSPWASLAKTLPAAPIGVSATRREIAPMAISIVQSATGFVSGGTSFNITFSSAPTSGNMLLLFCSVSTYLNSAREASVSGFSSQGRLVVLNNSMMVLSKTAGSGESSTYTVTVSGTSEYHSGIMYEISGANNSDPFNAIELVNSITSPSRTPTVIGVLPITAISTNNNPALSAPSGWSGFISSRQINHSVYSASKEIGTDTSTAYSATWGSATSPVSAIVLVNPASLAGEITPNKITHAQSMDAATLLQAHVLTVADLLNSQALDNATITQAFTLTPNDARNTQAMDVTTLLQQSVISPADLLQGNTLDATTLIQAHTLAVADLLHAQTLDNITLVVAGDISPSDMMTAQAMDSPLLLQAHIIAPNDARNTQVIDSPTIVQSNVLIPAGLDHAVILDSPVIVQANVISPSELLTTQAVDNVTLAVLGSLSVADLLSSQAIESPALTQAHTIGPSELMHVNSIDATTLFQGFILVPADLLHGQTIESALLDVIFGISPADMLHAQGIEQPGLIQAHVIFPADLLQANRFDVAGISSGLLRIPTGRAIVLGESDRYVLLTPADRFILLTPSTRVVS